MSAYFLIAASGFFLGENFYYFLWDVIYKLRTGNTDVGSATDIIQEIVRFVFVQGSFFGLILCYWRFPAPEARFDGISSEENREARISSDFVDRTGLAPCLRRTLHELYWRPMAPITPQIRKLAFLR
jgi:hypothetical protein